LASADLRRFRVSDSPESAVRKFFVAWEDPTADGLASFFAADAVHVSPLGAHHGVDAIKMQYQKQLAMGFAGFHIEVKRIVADGPTVMAERVDSFSLAGRTFEIEAAGVFEIDGDGRIKRFRDYYDLKSFTDEIEAAGFKVGA
jgi:limonene-1,2-epoxide hydrolase